jgi:hypothetical protein
MALSAAEMDALIADLSGQYSQLSREYSEIADKERKEDIADTMSSLHYQLARLEEQRQILGSRARGTGAG